MRIAFDKTPSSRHPWVVAALCFAVTGCGSSSLVELAETAPPKAQVPVVNHLTSLSVDYCTQPTQKKAFKTKFVVVFDRSGSNQPCTVSECGVAIPGTDPDASRRFGGMATFMSTLTAEQQTLFSFAFVDFSADPASYGSTTDPGIAKAAMDRGMSIYGHSFMTAAEFQGMMQVPTSLDATLGVTTGTLNGERNPYNDSSTVLQDGGWTDYILALKTTFGILNTDIQAHGASGGGSSSSGGTGSSSSGGINPDDQFAYVVIFASDGAPIVNPLLAPTYVQAQNPPPLTYRQPWQDPQAPDDIKREVDSIMTLNQFPQVLGISFNAVYYSAPGVPQDNGIGCSPTDPNCTPCIPGDPSCSPNTLLNTMSVVEGGGQYLDYTNGGNIDFTRITLPSMLTSFNMVEFYANNKNVVWYKGALAEDSDGDGLADAQEQLLGTSPILYSTLGNGVSDWVTNQVCAGQPEPGCMNALISSKCVAPSAIRNPDGSWPDRDGDGLNDCEELLLGSDPTNFDSNGDFLPDGLAALKGILFRLGDPLCSAQDEDFDGLNDCLEAKLNTPPDIPNSTVASLQPYQYTVTSTSSSLNSGQCYNIQVDNVTFLSPEDQIQFLVVEQPNLFVSTPTLRQAVKTVAPGTVSFAAADFH